MHPGIGWESNRCPHCLSRQRQRGHCDWLIKVLLVKKTKNLSYNRVNFNQIKEGLLLQICNANIYFNKSFNVWHTKLYQSTPKLI
jgi:hypothetical protein